MKFAKYEGLGNDFIIVETGEGSIDAARAAKLCDRHTGIGADGVLLVDTKKPSMQVLNADGSIAEMCGNGLRCVVWHLRRIGALKGDEVTIQTDAGPHRAWIRGTSDIEVVMQAGTVAPELVPVTGGQPVVDEALREVDGKPIRFTAVGMGNPHLVTFDPVGEARLQLGPDLQADSRFPQSVNVGFAEDIPGGFRLWVFERGSGWTRACGTGACAAAFAAVQTKRAVVGEPIAIKLPGGPLTITVRDEGIHMRGPAQHVFNGILPA